MGLLLSLPSVTERQRSIEREWDTLVHNKTHSVLAGGNICSGTGFS